MFPATAVGRLVIDLERLVPITSDDNAAMSFHMINKIRWLNVRGF